MSRRLFFVYCALTLAFVSIFIAACTTSPKISSPNESAAWGYLELVPREGVATGGASSAYGDRRLGGVSLVDYTRPGFAVVYIESPNSAPRKAPVAITIEDSPLHPRFSPRHAAAGVGATVRVENSSADTRILTCPAAGLIVSIAPGESIEFKLDASQAYELFLLDSPSASSTIFAAPGRFAEVSDSGRFALEHLTPGKARIAAWHPRFPPSSQRIELKAGEVTRIDLSLGVGHSKENDDASD